VFISAKGIMNTDRRALGIQIPRTTASWQQILRMDASPYQHLSIQGYICTERRRNIGTVVQCRRVKASASARCRVTTCTR
jgi:hypothetical protein